MPTLAMQRNTLDDDYDELLTLHLHVWLHAKQVTVCHLPSYRVLCVLWLFAIPRTIAKFRHLSRFKFSVFSLFLYAGWK